jgi:hypothetical protein
MRLELEDGGEGEREGGRKGGREKGRASGRGEGSARQKGTFLSMHPMYRQPHHLR